MLSCSQSASRPERDRPNRSGNQKALRRLLGRVAIMSALFCAILVGAVVKTSIAKSGASIIIHSDDPHHLSYPNFFWVEHISVMHISDHESVGAVSNVIDQSKWQITSNENHALLWSHKCWGIELCCKGFQVIRINFALLMLSRRAAETDFDVSSGCRAAVGDFSDDGIGNGFLWRIWINDKSSILKINKSSASGACSGISCLQNLILQDTYTDQGEGEKSNIERKSGNRVALSEPPVWNGPSVILLFLGFGFIGLVLISQSHLTISNVGFLLFVLAVFSLFAFAVLASTDRRVEDVGPHAVVVSEPTRSDIQKHVMWC